MMDKILSVKNIDCGYGDKTVLSGVDFCVKKREMVGMIGPNGSGKTTLLRAVTRNIPLKKGLIEFNGRPMGDMGFNEIAKKVAVVPQTRHDLFFNMTVEEIVTLGRLPHFSGFQWVLSKKDSEHIEEAIKVADIGHIRDKWVGLLSGGERQRVFIAKALVQQPELLLLDEPTMHLDIGYRIQIFTILKRLIKERGVTVLCVMHDLNLASVYCDRMIVIHDGRLKVAGSPAEVMRPEYIGEIYSADVDVYKREISRSPQILYKEKD